MSEIKKIKEDNAKIVVCDGNFHCRTTTVVSFSPSLGSKKNFGPLTPGFEMIKYNDIEALEKVLKKDKNIAGFLVEPIQGEGGVVVPDDGYLKKCKKIILGCTELPIAIFAFKSFKKAKKSKIFIDPNLILANTCVNKYKAA